MALVSYLPAVRKPIPHEPGEWMEFRKPTNLKGQDARDIEESKGRKSVRDFGAEIVKAMQMDPADDPTGEKAHARGRNLRKLQKDLYYDAENFDRTTLLRAGIVGWCYRDEDGKAINVTPDTIADLDEATAEWAKNFFAEMMRPSQEPDKSPAHSSAAAPAEPEGASAAV